MSTKKCILTRSFYFCAAMGLLFAVSVDAFAASYYGPPYTVNSIYGNGRFDSAGAAADWLIGQMTKGCSSSPKGCSSWPVVKYNSTTTGAIVMWPKDSSGFFVIATTYSVGSPRKNLGSCSMSCSGGLGAGKDGTGPRGSRDSAASANRAGSVFEGDPINTATGNFYRQETDYENPSGLMFRRFYNSSASVTSSTMGKQWRHLFDRKLEIQRSTSAATDTQSINAHRPDGGSLIFQLIGGVWKTSSDYSETLVERPDGAGFALAISATQQTEIYDAKGLLQEVYDKAGQRIYLLTYSLPDATGAGGGILQSVADRSGRQLIFDYDSAARLAGVTLPDKGKIVYSYDAAGYLASAKYSDEKSIGYIYNESNYTGGNNLPGVMTGVIDEKGVRYETITYQSSRKATSASFADGVDTTKIDYNAYSTNGIVDSAVIGPLGTRSGLTFVDAATGAIRLAGAGTPCGTQCNQSYKAITYDANGYVASTTDFQGNKSQTSFDSDGLLKQQIDGVGSSQQRTINTVWNGAIREPLERTILDAGNVVRAKSKWAYNASGLQTASCEINTAVAAALSYACGSAADAPAGVRQWRTSYCEKVDAANCPQVGLVLSVDGPRTDVSDITSYRYYASSDESGCGTASGQCHRVGDLFQSTNAAGQTTTYASYDSNGRPTRVIDSNAIATDFSYAPRGWLTSQITRFAASAAASSQDRVMTVAYDETGNVKQVTQPDGDFVKYDYDAAHRLTDITDSAGSNLHYSLDVAGNCFKEEIKDASGNVKRTLTRVYNKLGQLQTQADASANPTEFAYDLNGDLKLVTDALGRKTQLDPDPLRRVVRTLQDVGGLAVEITQQLDALDRVTAVIDPKGLTTRYDYSSLGDLGKLTSPDTGATTYSYDAAGNRTLEATARGVKISSSYDVLGRLTKLSYPTSALNVAYSYDVAPVSCQAGETFAQGRLASIKDSSGATEYCYNSFGDLVRKLQTTNGKAFTLRYGYTASGRLASVIYPDGAKVDYVRNGLGQATEVGYTSATGARQILLKNASYLPLGPIAGWTYGNGRVLTRAYDQDYRPKAIQDTSAGGLDVGFGFDPVGNLSKLTPAGGTVADVTLGYDPLGRLTEFKDGVTGTVLDGYTYDKTGNRQSSKSAAGEVAYTYEANSHRLIKVGGAPRVYNAVGDTTSINGTEREFVYDVTGRMSQVKRNGAVAREYRYNGKGEQVRGFLGTANTYTLYDEFGRWMGDYDNAGKPLQQAIWLDDMPVGVTSADAKLAYIEPDHLGSPRVVIDPARNTAVWAWNLKSEAFGLTNPDQDADKDGSNFLLNMRFPGQRYDSFSGLNQNYYREYDTSSGRYTQSDPIGQGGGLNLYGYVKNAPYSWKDVDGQQAISLSANPAVTGATALSGHALQNPSELTVDGSFGDYRGNPLSPVFDLVHLMASPGNQADSGVVQIVSRIQSDAVLAGRKRPDRCEVLQQLIDSGVIPAKAAKATQKAWGCRPSRISKDRC
ncbi:polymorphic toxin type 34 domain-containing protein [Xanthomonas hortorum]|nr:polymorphic toxin type 34 domain-containing protein [Xanthomonas hortorum]MCE4353561.1 polymorphic toxin type 34 domain-containing protein [Xanthomonas hortorum pv. pelargonii]MCM5525520.1 polymorphic toxin type 34 domain-containing protein [Xanthomonas hortorum pv. pelargonii]MCM5537978.1 polymorphic toxin type 34 domain-containing protein [Xanthomonas hortorum pv. pelargonii]MCM5542141.1 polymorphic toxin type 34 domain-containing protein [Xanthomonas hortorum pv. pelargonii]MCM5545705.1 